MKNRLVTNRVYKRYVEASMCSMVKCSNQRFLDLYNSMQKMTDRIKPNGGQRNTDFMRKTYKYVIVFSLECI